jgi:hypothetical protein
VQPDYYDLYDFLMTLELGVQARGAMDFLGHGQISRTPGPTHTHCRTGRPRIESALSV